MLFKIKNFKITINILDFLNRDEQPLITNYILFHVSFPDIFMSTDKWTSHTPFPEDRGMETGIQ